MLIIGPPTADWSSIRPRLAQMGASELFGKDIAPVVWDAAVDYGIDPVGMLAQAAMETGWGKFGRAMHPWHRNPAGLKVRDLNALAELGVSGDGNPLCHAQFATWDVGAKAQAQHLWAYMGWRVPRGDLVDPRYDWVVGKHSCKTFEDLGTRWAPAADYGKRIVSLASQLQGA
jgi:N-acetylmuramoyl-L-alanine amidase